MSADVANGPDRHSSRGPEWGAVRRQSINMAFAIVGLAILFALVGAYDTDTIGFARRLVLWLIVSALILGQAQLLDYAFAQLAPAGLVWRLVAGGAAAVATVALTTVELYALKATPLTPDVWGDDALLELVPNVAPPVLFFVACVVLIRVRLEGWRTRPVPWRNPDGSLAFPRPPVIAGLLPAPAHFVAWPAGSVQSVRAQDHYLEVEADGKRRFIRGRMQEAVARLTGTDGMRVHRSWWVARSMVVEARRQGRDYTLVLTDGREVPVSRSRIPALRANGWL
jgi:hypothetical protein